MSESLCQQNLFLSEEERAHTHTQRRQRESGASYVVLIANKKSSGTIFGLWIFIFAGTVIRFPNLETLGNGKETKLSLSIFSSFVLTRGTVPA